MKKLNEKGMAHWIVPTFVVALIAVVGVRVLAGSHADNTTLDVTPAAATTSGTLEGPYLAQIDNYSNAVNSSKIPGTTTATTTDVVGVDDNFSQVVSVVQPGQTLVYKGSDTAGIAWNGTLKEVCYTLRVPYTNANNTPQVTATLELENYDSSKTVNLGSEGVYSSYCFKDNITVGPTTALGWSIKNVSPSTGPPVYVYQKEISVNN